MMFLIAEHFRLAHQAFKASQMRTFLTVIGIAIGIACITAVLSLSNGVLSTLTHQTQSTDGQMIVVRPGPEVNLSLRTASDPTSAYQFSVSTLHQNDVELISALADVNSTAPIMTLIGNTRRTDSVDKNTSVVATTTDLLDFNNFKMAEGTFIDDSSNLNTSTIGAQLALDLFGTKSPIGQTFTFKDKTFTVTGVFERVNEPVSVYGFNIDDSVFISMTQGKSLIDGDIQLQQINILADSSAQVSQVASAISDRLAGAHHGDHDFHILHGKSIAGSQNALYQSMAGTLFAVASISLIVGGIGIMNIMLVNVSERTREIGLRKAVGASNNNILWQFLIESLGISLIGGIAGILIGFLASFIITIFVPFAPSYSWQILLTAVIVSVTTGVVFGIYPALKASRKDPIESLRFYR